MITHTPLACHFYELLDLHRSISRKFHHFMGRHTAYSLSFSGAYRRLTASMLLCLCLIKIIIFVFILIISCPHTLHYIWCIFHKQSCSSSSLSRCLIAMLCFSWQQVLLTLAKKISYFLFSFGTRWPHSESLNSLPLRGWAVVASRHNYSYLI